MSFTRMRYHLVTATKNREWWLVDEVERVVYATMLTIMEKLKV